MNKIDQCLAATLAILFPLGVALVYFSISHQLDFTWYAAAYLIQLVLGMTGVFVLDVPGSKLTWILSALVLPFLWASFLGLFALARMARSQHQAGASQADDSAGDADL